MIKTPKKIYNIFMNTNQSNTKIGLDHIVKKYFAPIDTEPSVSLDAVLIDEKLYNPIFGKDTINFFLKEVINYIDNSKSNE